MLELPALPAAAEPEPATAAPAARFLRPTQQYALNFSPQEVTRETRNDLA
jgi:hypothetical protein